MDGTNWGFSLVPHGPVWTFMLNGFYGVDWIRDETTPPQHIAKYTKTYKNCPQNRKYTAYGTAVHTA